MQRLDFVLPETTRVAWVSANAEQVWQPRIHKIQAAWDQLERLSLLDFRLACLQTLDPEKLQEVAQWALENNFVMVPLNQVKSSQSYSARAEGPNPGEPFAYRTVITSPRLALKFLEAWKTQDNDTIGALLGYPACCRAFFDKYWIKENLIDTAWPMSHGGDDEYSKTILQARAECNVLLRYLGVRLVPFLPCGFGCANAREVGQNYVRTALQHGFKQEIHWLQEMLSWPVEWSALHGYAEVKTPVFKILANTDATAEKYTVQVRGSLYPTEGVSGNVFPYIKIKETPRNKNGFDSNENQTLAHQPIVDLVHSKLSQEGLFFFDFGCGDGTLVKKLAPFGTGMGGIEIDADRAPIFSNDSEDWFNYDMFNTSLWYFLKLKTKLCPILNPLRLVETRTDRDWFINQLKRYAKYIVVYSYNKGLADLVDKSGLSEAYKPWAELYNEITEVMILERK